MKMDSQDTTKQLDYYLFYTVVDDKTSSLYVIPG